MVAELKADPYGSVGGIYNIKTHTTQLANAGSDMLWTNSPDTQTRPVSPPIYHPHSTTLFKHPSPPIQPTISTAVYRQSSPPTHTHKPAIYKQNPIQSSSTAYKQMSPINITNSTATYKLNTPSTQLNSSPATYKQNLQTNIPMYTQISSQSTHISQSYKNSPAQSTTSPIYKQHLTPTSTYKSVLPSPAYNPQSASYRPLSSKPRSAAARPLVVRKPLYKVHDNGDGAEPRLPSIDEHCKLDVQDKYPRGRTRTEEERLRLRSCPERTERRAEFYRKAGDGLPR